MPAAFASSKSSKDGEDKELIIDTMTSGDNASASASSQNKDGSSIFQKSKTTRNQDGTETKKTWGISGADDSHTTGKQGSEKKGGDRDGEEGLFNKAINAFAKTGGAAAGGAVASAGDGKAVANSRLWVDAVATTVIRETVKSKENWFSD
ncbi:hypothetical protein N0V90_005044 [Kalmusia sp. IMI 367209]|nr:hypothetical protein N0V90_005044 [Kalmusia sp. IMI 367209]